MTRSASPDGAGLERLLSAGDPDLLAAARDDLDGLDEQDDARIHEVLSAWEDVPAVANLLMYPEVVVEDERMPALLRGLRDDAEPYLALAASVGLQRLAEDPLEDDPEDDEELRDEVVAALRDVIARSDGALAARAQLALRLWAPDVDGPLPPLVAIPSYGEWRAGS